MFALVQLPPDLLKMISRMTLCIEDTDIKTLDYEACH